MTPAPTVPENDDSPVTVMVALVSPLFTMAPAPESDATETLCPLRSSVPEERIVTGLPSASGVAGGSETSE